MKINSHKNYMELFARHIDTLHGGVVTVTGMTFVVGFSVTETSTEQN